MGTNEVKKCWVKKIIFVLGQAAKAEQNSLLPAP
jgi:hypothetical protein